MDRGFTLVELLFAMLILAIVITTTLAVFFDRQKHLQRASELTLAYQVLSNEAEVWRRYDFHQLQHVVDISGSDFHSPTTILAPLGAYTTVVKVDQLQKDLKDVTLTIRWHGGERTARLQVLRSDTGGSNLW